LKFAFEVFSVVLSVKLLYKTTTTINKLADLNCPYYYRRFVALRECYRRLQASTRRTHNWHVPSAYCAHCFVHAFYRC